MATLILIRLDCAEQEDWTGDDDIYILVNGKKVWANSMDEGQSRDLGSMSVPFDGTATIQLKEEDWPDGDDNLGTVTVNDQGTAATSRAARFTQDDADYTLWYSVYGNNPPAAADPAAGAPQQCTPGDPAAGAGPGGAGAPGDPGEACQMARLVAEVRDPATGTVIQGASVRCPDRGFQGVTGADGHYDFGWVLPGNVAVEAWMQNYYPFPATTQVYVQHRDDGQPTVAVLYLSQETVVEVRPADCKWYINLDADESKQQGREVTVWARLATPTPGVRIYFTLDRDPNNRANPPSPASLAPASGLTSDQGWAWTKLTLSTYGGDKFRVSASLSPNTPPGTAGAKESGWVTVWRKVFYNITQMAKPGGGFYEMAPSTMGFVQTAMNNVFLELVSLGAPNNVNETVSNFESADDAYKWADKHTTNVGVPWKLNYVVVGYSCKPEDKEFLSNPINTALSVVGPNFRPYDFDGKQWLLSAQYKPAVGGSWTNCPAGMVTRVGAISRSQFQVDFSKAPGVNPVTTPQLVKVKYISCFEANGWGGSSLHLIICRGTFDENYAGVVADLGTVMAGTSIHEPGHSLGLVMGLAWEGTAQPGHRSHCQNQNCVMWFQGYVGRPHDFHLPAVSDPGCHTFMRGLDMSRAANQARWGFPR